MRGWRGAGRVRLLPAAGVGVLAELGEFTEIDVELDLGGLPGPVGEPAGGDEPAAGFFQGVVVALPLGAGVLGPGFLAERVQDGLDGLGAAGGEVAVEAPGSAEGGLEPQVPVLEPVIVVVGGGEPAPHFLGEPGQVLEPGPAGGGGEQDLVGV